MATLCLLANVYELRHSIRVKNQSLHHGKKGLNVLKYAIL